MMDNIKVTVEEDENRPDYPFVIVDIDVARKIMGENGGAAAMRCYLELLRRTDEDTRRAIISQMEIEHWWGMSRSSVAKGLDLLQRMGIVKVYARWVNDVMDVTRVSLVKDDRHKARAANLYIVATRREEMF